MGIHNISVLEEAVVYDGDANATIEYETAIGIYGFEADNSQNTVDVYLKIWDAASGLTLGSSAPAWVFRIPAGQKRCQPMGDLGIGATLANGLAFAAVTSAADAGTSGPTNDVEVTFLTDKT
jgi:hypothetical protein